MFLAKLPIYKRLTQQRSINFAKYIAKLVPENSKVLDFGCGNMYTAIELQKIQPSIHVTGMDVIKDQNLDEKLLQNHNLAFKLLTTKEVPFPDNTFDIVIALATMHHTVD